MIKVAKEVKVYSVLAELELDVCYRATNEMEMLHDDSIAGVNVLVTNLNGNVLELKVMNWEFTDVVVFEEDEMVYAGFKVAGLTEVEEDNEKRASAKAQYIINDLTIQEIVVTATLNNGTVLPLKVNDHFTNVESIQEM